MPSDATKSTRQDQAAAWFAAERAGLMLVEQRAEFDEWRRDPRNQAAFDAMYDLWHDLEVLKVSAPAPKKVATSKLLPIAAAFFVLVIGGLATMPLLFNSAETAITTLAGQQRTESMPDGSVIAVNVATKVSFKVTGEERLVTLAGGEAAFTVKPDADQPFVVRAGDYEIRAVGTAFNVKQRDGAVEVAVSEGSVEICRASGRRELLATLAAGQAIDLPAGFAIVEALPDPRSIPAAQVAEWRMRIVTYEDATVKEVVDDLNRYFETKLQVDQPGLLSRRITIRLRVDNRDGAIETLAALLGARLVDGTQGQSLRE